MASAIFLSSTYVADYYHQVGIRSVIRLAFGFLLIPFGSVTHALLTRELRAKEQALVNIAGTAVYAAVSIALAYFGLAI